MMGAAKAGKGLFTFAGCFMKRSAYPYLCCIAVFIIKQQKPIKILMGFGVYLYDLSIIDH